MQAAEIVERSGLREGEGKGVVGIKWLRPEGLVLVDDVVRDIVVVDPLDRRTDRYRQRFWPEQEVLDDDRIGVLRRSDVEGHRSADGQSQNRGGDRALARDERLNRQAK